MKCELIPGHIYYLKVKSGSEYIFEYVKRSARAENIIVSKPCYYDVRYHIKQNSSYSEENGLCRLVSIDNAIEIREATPEEAKLLGVENYNSKLKINHKQFKLKFKL